MFFGILIFDPNRPFCMMDDFQNGIISGIFGVFSRSFLHGATLMWLSKRFLHVFSNLNF